MRMHYLKHHAEELESIQVKWKKGYYSVEVGHIVPRAPFYPSEHPFTAIDDPTFPAPRLEIDEEKYQQMEGAAAPLSTMVRPTLASRMYRMEARRWEDEAPPRKRSRTPSPLVPAEIPAKREGGIQTARDHAAAMGVHRNWRKPGGLRQREIVWKCKEWRKTRHWNSSYRIRVYALCRLVAGEMARLASNKDNSYNPGSR